LQSWFIGSGDPEVDDAIDPREYLTITYGNDYGRLQTMLMGLQSKLEELDPTWLGHRRAGMPLRHYCLTVGGVTMGPGWAGQALSSVHRPSFEQSHSVKGQFMLY